MKTFIYIFIALVTGTSAIHANRETVSNSSLDYYNGQRYIFMEGGIEFSVYPDGEFDFVVPQVITSLNINLNTGPANISYNSGFDYDAFVQYDQYGAVIQIGNVPVYYDNWGRIIQAGSIYLNYDNELLARIGGLSIFYRGGNFAYNRGYINNYNRNLNPGYYANYFYRPYMDRCLVYTNPYRRYYHPTRYSYNYHRDHYRQGYRDGYANAYHDFKRPQGQIAHNSGRSGSYAQAREITRSNAVSRTARTTSSGANRSVTARTATVTRDNGSSNQTSRSYQAPQQAAPVRNSTTAHRTTSSISTQNNRVVQRNLPRVSNNSSSNSSVRSSSPAVNRAKTVATPQRSVSRSIPQNTQVRRTSNTRTTSPVTSRTSRSSRSTTVSRSRGNN